MNCPDCSESLAVGVYRCACGWHGIEPVKRYHGPPVPVETPELLAAKARCMESAKKLSFNKPGNRDWAYRLMAKLEAGEKLTPIQFNLASEAIRTDPDRRYRGAP